MLHRMHESSLIQLAFFITEEKEKQAGHPNWKLKQNLNELYDSAKRHLDIFFENEKTQCCSGLEIDQNTPFDDYIKERIT